MSTNAWDNIITDDYDIYNLQGVPEALPGTPDIDSNGNLIIPDNGWLIHYSNNPSVMDDRNTGITTDFWSAYPITIDINGDLYYYNENTGINVRGPAGAPKYIRFDELTQEEIEQLKGQDGKDGYVGKDGLPGRDGLNGADAYHVWLEDQGYEADEHPIEEFYKFLGGYVDTLVKEGSGQGSLIVNYEGEENTASGEGSFASGLHTSADGNYSFTAGLGTHAVAANQFVIGKYNIGKQNTVFEVGNGSIETRQNCLELTSGGSLIVTGDITDGTQNILSNKVDKIAGKTLSTNDFTNTYKNFLDNYYIEQTVIQTSNNPVTSSGIYSALQQVREEVASKPTMELGTADTDFPILSYRPVGDDETLEISVKFNSLLWNPNRNILKAGSSLTVPSALTYNTLLGQGLTSASNNQIILGKYNTPNQNDLLQVGFGVSISETENMLTLSKTGDLTVYGEVTDGSNNVLSNKQDILDFDTIPTEDSNNVMTSGSIYNTLIDVGITPGEGINIPEIPNIQQDITDINTDIASLRVTINNLTSTLHHFIDDATGDEYMMGVSNGEVYIKNLTEPEPDPDDNDEDEEENIEEGGE